MQLLQLAYCYTGLFTATLDELSIEGERGDLNLRVVEPQSKKLSNDYSSIALAKRAEAEARKVGCLPACKEFRALPI